MIFEPAVGQYLFLLARNIGEFYTSLFVRVNVLRQSLCQPFVSPPFGSSNKLHQHFTELDICCSCFLFQFCQKPVYLLLNISPEDFVFPYANKDFRRDDSKVSVLFLDIIKTRIMQ